MRTLLIIPAFNESKSIVALVDQIIQQGYDYVVINDGSTDNTLDVCRKNNITTLDLSRNLGIGGAVQTGHKYAFRNGYDIDIQIDGDGQHDISYIPLLIEEIKKGADLVIGSRFLDSSEGFKSTFMRRVGISWLSGLIRLFYHKSVTDPTSGFRASGRKALELFNKSYPSDYPEPESIAELLNHRMTVAEVPVCMNERKEGKSSINALSSMYYMIKVTLAILIHACTKNLIKGDAS
jgi:glycosyltransferase involved in cell wall biosynthesis